MADFIVKNTVYPFYILRHSGQSLSGFLCRCRIGAVRPIIFGYINIHIFRGCVREYDLKTDANARLAFHQNRDSVLFGKYCCRRFRSKREANFIFTNCVNPCMISAADLKSALDDGFLPIPGLSYINEKILQESGLLAGYVQALHGYLFHIPYIFRLFFCQHKF
jgi:hypothetical protein